jgi:O-antigen/teichoic acid export membrane protein
MSPNDGQAIKRRVQAGALSHGVGLLVTIATQILSVPIFLSVWSLEQYGTWLIISALPVYFSIADGGFVSVAINKICMAAELGDWSQANRIFQSTLALLAILTLTVLMVLGGGLLLPWGFHDPHHKWAFLLLVMVTFGNLFMGFFDAVFRAGHEYPLITFLINLGRLAEWLGGVAGLILGRSLLSVAIGMLAGRLGVILLLGLLAHQRHPQLHWGFRQARRLELKAMFLPACTTLIFPLGSAMNLSGITLLVGKVFGPQFLVLFNAYRTLSRSAVQLVGLVNKAVWPEVTRLYAQGRAVQIQKIRSKVRRMTWLFLPIVALLLVLLGPWILKTWTHGKVEFHLFIYVGLVAIACLNATWQLDGIILLALNLHSRFAASYLVISCLLLATLISAGSHLDFKLLLGSMIVSEIAIIWNGKFYVDKRLIT